LGDITGFLRRLKIQGDILGVPHIPYEELELEEYDPQIPDQETVYNVLKAISIPRAGVFIARSTMGFRPSEARRLNVSDLKLGRRDDLADAHISLPARKSKKKRPRKLELRPLLRLWFRHPEVEATFGKLENRWGEEPLFPNPLATNEDGRWSETSEKRTLYKAYRDAGVLHIKPNEMGRHFFATTLVNDGADVYGVKEWLGHSDISTTERYAKLRPQTIARIFERRAGR
jgi:site-specific recombinase XerD